MVREVVKILRSHDYCNLGRKRNEDNIWMGAPILIRESPSQRRTSSGEKENDASIACKVYSV